MEPMPDEKPRRTADDYAAASAAWDNQQLRTLMDEEARAATEAPDEDDGEPLPPHVTASRPNRHPTDDEYAALAADYAANPVGANEVRGPIEINSLGKPPAEPRTRAPYEATVTRDGEWWMIRVPELAGHVNAAGARNVSDTTQARDSLEIAQMARDFICTVTDAEPSDVDVHITIAPA